MAIVSIVSLVFVLGFIIYAAATGQLSPQAKTDIPEPKKYEAQPPVQDHILVKFKDKVSQEEKEKIHQKTGGKVKDEIKQIGVQIVDIPKGKGITPETFVETYKGNFKEELEFAEVDQVISPSLWPNDPYFKYGQLQLQWMGGPEAWDITTGSSSMLIAVLDTGADFSHPDLQGRLVAGWDFFDNDADPTDENGHGTKVTGILGAATNNGLGIAAVSWRNPVLVVRIGGYEGWTTTGLIAKGIAYAADQGVRAINISFAGPGYSSTEDSAVNYAWNKGAVTVAGAGNSGTDTPYYPAALPKVVAVSGLDGNNVIWYGSNYGYWIDVSAPSSSLSTSLGGGINQIGGTSISAPFVTGLFGLVFSANPNLTPQQATDVVTSTAKDLGDPGFDQYYGWGKIDIYQAVLKASQGGGTPTPTPSPTPTPTPTPSPSPSPTVTTGNITGKVSDSSGTALALATVSAYQAGTLIKSTSALADGTYTLSDLTQGTYDLTSSLSGYQSQTQTGIQVVAGLTTAVNFSLPANPAQQYGSLTGVVTDTAQNILPSAKVTAINSQTGARYTATANSLGVYTFTNLPVGTYSLRATFKGGLSGTGTTTVTSGQITTVNITIKKK